MYVSHANYDGSNHGVFTRKPGTMSNEFFKNLLYLRTTWKALDVDQTVFEGRDRKSNEVKRYGTRTDLIFGSNSELRTVAEAYGQAESEEKFVHDFVKTWNKVMMLDRFDLK